MARLIAVLLAALALPPQAAAAPKLDLRPVGTTDGPVLGDGVRFAAWQQGTAVSVMDDRGPTRALPLTSACPPSRPQAHALGSGRLLVQSCSGSSSNQRTRLEVHDLASGVRHDVAPPGTIDPTTYGGGFPASFEGVGRHWITVGTGSNHWSAIVFHNWRTGEVIEDTDGPEFLPHLDRSRLHVRLCAPLARPENPNATSGTETYPLYRGIRYRNRRALMISGRDQRARLELWRCGSARPTVLARCRQGCGSFDLTAAHAVWLDNAGVRIRHLRTRRTYVARVPAGVFGKPAVSGRRLLVRSGDTVYAARLPRR